MSLFSFLKDLELFHPLSRQNGGVPATFCAFADFSHHFDKYLVIQDRSSKCVLAGPLRPANEASNVLLLP
uniref:Uncharacterized protein n=1 Tax=Heterorhabditis bacteriophora TaxID=37862 RepID=A0A1I7WZX8_HETBA